MAIARPGSPGAGDLEAKVDHMETSGAAPTVASAPPEEMLRGMRLEAQRKQLQELAATHATVRRVLSIMSHGKPAGLGPAERAFLRLLEAAVRTGVLLDGNNVFTMLQQLHEDVMAVPLSELDLVLAEGMVEARAEGEPPFGIGAAPPATPQLQLGLALGLRPRIAAAAQGVPCVQPVASPPIRMGATSGGDTSPSVGSPWRGDDVLGVLGLTTAGAPLAAAAGFASPGASTMKRPASAGLGAKLAAFRQGARPDTAASLLVAPFVTAGSAASARPLSAASVRRPASAAGPARPASVLRPGSMLTPDMVLGADAEEGALHGRPASRAAGMHATGAGADVGVASGPGAAAANAVRRADRQEPTSHVARDLLTDEERAASYVRRMWPVLLYAPMAVLLTALHVDESAYAGWLAERGLQQATRQAVARMEARQRHKAEAEAEAAAQAAEKAKKYAATRRTSAS
jgi:hypothetical protein